ncbi:MAG: hypothetical protein ABW024_07885, partial [Microbacterium sp.]
MSHAEVREIAERGCSAIATFVVVIDLAASGGLPTARCPTVPISGTQKASLRRSRFVPVDLEDCSRHGMDHHAVPTGSPTR